MRTRSYVQGENPLRKDGHQIVTNDAFKTELDMRTAFPKVNVLWVDQDSDIESPGARTCTLCK